MVFINPDHLLIITLSTIEDVDMSSFTAEVYAGEHGYLLGGKPVGHRLRDTRFYAGTGIAFDGGHYVYISIQYSKGSLIGFDTDTDQSWVELNEYEKRLNGVWHDSFTSTLLLLLEVTFGDPAKADICKYNTTSKNMDCLVPEVSTELTVDPGYPALVIVGSVRLIGIAGTQWLAVDGTKKW